MAIFDSLIGEVGRKFGLENSAESLLGSLLSYITSKDSGGITGFISKFTGSGLGDVVNSWIGRGENKEITGDQLTSVLGGETIDRIAENAGVSSAAATPALAYMLPKVVNGLTPDGIVPTSLPETLTSYISSLTGMLGKGMAGAAGAAGAAASGAADIAGAAISGAADLASKGIGAAGNLASGATGAVGAGLAGAAGMGMAGAKAAADFTGETAKSGASWLIKLLPLLLLLLAAFLAYRYCSTAQPTAPTTTNTAPSAAPAPKVDSSLQVVNAGGIYKVNATVPSEADKAKLLDQLKATYGEGKYEANIKVDPNAKPATWLTKIGDALKELKAPGTELSIVGGAITISGLAADAANALKTKLGSLFGADFNIGTKILDAAAAVKDAAAAAATALTGLKPGFTADELVKALNLEIINFASGSNNIPKENEELLKKSAESIKQAPAGTKLEVGGHTDNKGAAAGNLKLSEARAAAVKAFLVKQGVKAEMLTSKGYGADKPVASNDTEEGRFKNRRIEFSVTK